MLVAALFPLAKTGEECKCPWTDGWIKNMWCIHTQWNTPEPQT